MLLGMGPVSSGLWHFVIAQCGAIKLEFARRWIQGSQG